MSEGVAPKDNWIHHKNGKALDMVRSSLNWHILVGDDIDYINIAELREMMDKLQEWSDAAYSKARHDDAQRSRPPVFVNNY